MNIQAHKFRSYTTAIAVATLVLASGCQFMVPDFSKKSGSSKEITYYPDPVARTDADGKPVLDASGKQIVDLGTPQTMTERMVMVMMQERALDGCIALATSRQEALKAGLASAAGSATASVEWARTKAQEDLIIALKPDYDPTGCGTLFAATESYWQMVSRELSAAVQGYTANVGLIRQALKTLGFILVIDSIGDTVVGIANAAGGVNIGNMVAGNSKGGGGNVGDEGVGGGVSSSVDGSTIDFSNATIQLPSGKSLAGADNAIVTGSEGNQQQTDNGSAGLQGQVTTDPNLVTQPQAGAGAEAEGGDVNFGPAQGNEAAVGI